MSGKLRLLCGAAALLTLQLPACNFTAGIETMLSPPRLTVEQEQIYQALQTAAGSQISLKYPKSGERLSAFTVADLDGDGSDEAIVFYEAGRSSDEENPLRLCLLDQRGGKWNAVAEYPAAGTEIERVDVEQLGTNPRMNLIIRYSHADGAEHAAGVYHYADGTLTQSLSFQYSMMELRDLDLDGALELFVTSAAKTPAPATATVYALDADGQYVPSQLSLPENFSDVTRMEYSILPDADEKGIPAIYLDGTTGANTAQTAVLAYRDQLLTFLYADAADSYPNTSRPAGCQTMDIDGDGELEIPVNAVFYGYSGTSEAPQISMTNWYICRNGRLIRDHASYYAVQEGYVFVMPDRWENNVTAVQENEEIVFYTFDRDVQNPDGTPVPGVQLLRLAVVNDAVAADAMQSEGYLLLRRQNGNYYLGAVKGGMGTLRMTESELLFSVQVLS